MEGAMTLTRSARRMLEQGTRPARLIMERPAIVAALEHAGLPVFEPIVAFQHQYGGITYKVNGRDGKNTLGLFQPEISAWKLDGQHYYFDCLSHATAPMGVYLGEDGTVSVYGNWFSSPVAIASSMEKYLESEAREHELIDLSFTWSFSLGVVAQGDTRLGKRLDLPVLASASDAYTTWWGNRDLRVVQRVYWTDGPPQHQRVLYARTQADARQLKDSLRDLIPPPSRR